MVLGFHSPTVFAYGDAADDDDGDDDEDEDDGDDDYDGDDYGLFVLVFLCVSVYSNPSVQYNGIQ